MKITLKPEPKQHLAYEALKDKEIKYVVFGGAAGGGKSWLGCEWLMTMALQFPETRYFIARNELSRLMTTTFVTWTKVCSHHKFKDWTLNGQYHYIQLKNGSRIDLIDVKNNPSDPLYERLGGLEYTGGVIEEGGEVEFRAFDVLKSRIGRHLNDKYGIKPKILITCNPKKNWLYTQVYKPFVDGTLEKDFTFIQALYGDNSYTRDIYAEQLSSVKDKVLKDRLMFGSWEYEDNPLALIPYDNIIDLFSNYVDESEKKYISADIARYGNDSTVITLWKGFHCYEIHKYKKTGLDIIAEEIKRLAHMHGIPFSHIIIDEDGVGGGVLDHLRGAKGFMGNRTPFPNRLTGKPDNYRNLKSQCSYIFADFANEHKIRIDAIGDVRDKLIEELEQIKAKEALDDTKLQVESKDRIKEILGRSPDLSDAMVMRMYFELEQPSIKNVKHTSLLSMLLTPMRREADAGENTYL